MENWLIGPTKKTIIREVRRILYGHPRFRQYSENVFNKFQMEDRPSRGVIVNAASSDKVDLASDNYMGRLESFVMLTRVGNSPNTTLEWVKENNPLLERYSPLRSVFPSPPGVYLFEVKSLPDLPNRVPGTFDMTPVLTVKDEALITFGSSMDLEAQLPRGGIYPGSVRLWLDGRRPLLQGVDFSVDHEDGSVVFLKETPTGLTITADYRYAVPGLVGARFSYDTADATTIPGAILAFGDRAELGDQFAVVVGDARTEVADVHGGKFETNLELVVFVQNDAEEREAMSDFLVIQLLDRREALGFQGLEILNVSPGGESEEVYNQTFDDYYYESPISLSVRVDWQIFRPLPVEISRAEVTSRSAELLSGYLDGSAPADLTRPGSPLEGLGQAVSIGRGLGFERL